MDKHQQMLSPALPVLFHVAGTKMLEPGDYCEGRVVQLSRYWDGYRGWQPCIMVELGDAF